MKKIKKLFTIGLVVLLMLCMGGCFPRDFLNRELKKFPIECDKYRLDSARRVNEKDILDCVEFPDIKPSEENFNENGFRVNQQEVYKKNGLRIIRKVQDDIYGNFSFEFIVYEQEKSWYINQEFMEQSETFVSYSAIWKKWSDKAGYPNIIVGLRMSIEQEIFIITSSTIVQMAIYGRYPKTLWYFDREQGKMLYCDYLKEDDGYPMFASISDMVIVKTQ